MKKSMILLLLCVFGINIPGVFARANNLKTFTIILQDTISSKHKVYKKRKRVIRRHTSTIHSERMEMQLRQADKHLKEEQKVQRVQQQVKKDTGNKINPR
jgi:transposase